ncbi:histidine kinase [Streptomyces sp. CT34]|uniref:sensor histidine kinase n=1 Tax=Streptomyces sp. CT34 TaxID=1553907 RepID=UPI0032200E84
MTDPVRALFAPGMWTPWRIVGEVLLSVMLGLLAAGTEAATGHGTVRIMAVAVLAALLSMLRRVLPATVLLVVAITSGWFDGLGPLVPVAAWSAGRRIDGVGRAAGTFAAAYALSLGTNALADTHNLPFTLAVTAPLLLVMVVVPGLISRYWSQRRTLADTLREYNAQLLRERTMIAGQARMRERQRIAQDMHDSLGHQLTLIAVHTGALEVDRELTGRQREAVAVLREASVAAMHELREVVGLLRDGTESPGQADAPRVPEAVGREDTTAPSRGVAGIEGLVEASRSAGTTVEFRRSGEPQPLAPTADHAAYRVAQEGLTNAHKHAPGASITIELRYEPDALVVEVANDPAPETTGPGRNVVSGGQGLTGLGERTRLIGGMVHAGPTADGGFRLAGVLPYTTPESSAPNRSPGGAESTFTDRTGDFREQLPAGSRGEDDFVGLPKELARAVHRKTKRRGMAIGCGGAALVIVVLPVVVMGVAALFLAGGTDQDAIGREEYDAVKVGQSEAEVRAKLPRAKSSFLTDALDRGAPPEPQGANCLTLMSTETAGSTSKEPVFRFCFKDRKLIEKKSFEVRE